MTDSLLSARAARRFLDEYWRKKPKLARNQVSGLDASIDRKTLIELACCDDVESRLVIGARRDWSLQHGPFRKRDFTRLPSRNWTLLVNGVENHIPAARALQMRFGFIPYARHDDVMVSYAAPGGGVGPHYDSYDVFLLQGTGRRRWQISHQSDLALIDGAPLKILRRFRAHREWVLQCGDALYLPPNHAHHGVALDECITWSIGLRAPSQQEMAARFLDYLQDRLSLTGSYDDPQLQAQRHPAEIDSDMLSQIRSMIDGIRWNNADVQRCLGEYLTEPRSSVVFKQERSMPSRRFAGAVATRGVSLALKSRMLRCAGMIFINGETVTPSTTARKALRELADQRRLRPGARLAADAREILYQWYRAGYVVLGE